MATLDWTLRATGEVTLVQVAVRADVRRTVRIDHELDGPVWPPRSQGQPLAGWDGAGYEGTVTPDTPLVLGYATPADPAEPPVSLTLDLEPDGGDLTPAALVRTLGAAGPPREAVPELGRSASPARSTPCRDTGADLPPAPPRPRE